jgi:hypothetical protein
MAEQRFGFFGKDVTRYIPPELRPFTKLAVDMNPVTGFQRAGQALKEGKYGESALETGILALPAGAYALRNVIKPSVTAGVDALKELFLLGAADDVAKKTPAAKQGLSRREVLTGMGAAALAAPVGKGIVDLVPPAPAAKVAKTALKGPVAAAVAKANTLRDLYFGKTKVFSDTKNVRDAIDQAKIVSPDRSDKIGDLVAKSAEFSEKMDKVTLALNKDLDKILKDAGDFSKFSDDELIALGEMKLEISHMMRSGKGPDDFIRSGDPLRTEKVSKALDKEIEARGLRSQIRDKGLEQMMQTIEGKRAARKSSVIEPPLKLDDFDIKKMLPSGSKFKDIKKSDLVSGYNERTGKGSDEPTRFYHGTSKGFEDFDETAEYTFVADHPKTAEYFTDFSEKGSFYKPSSGQNIRPVYLKKANYFDVDNDDHIKLLEESKFFKENEKDLNDFVGYEFEDDKTFIDSVMSGDFETMEDSRLVDWIKSQGFDGFTTYEQFGKNYAVFDTDNIIPGIVKKAEGGVAGLSDIARDMFKGPKGIGAYESFMVG